MTTFTVAVSHYADGLIAWTFTAAIVRPGCPHAIEADSAGEANLRALDEHRETCMASAQ